MSPKCANTSGSYQVEVEDANSCTETETIIVDELVSTLVQELDMWKLYPTMARDIMHLEGVPFGALFQLITPSGKIMETGITS